MQSLSRTLALFFVACAVPAIASAGDPCAAVMCLSSTSPPKECKKEIDGYFDIRAYKHGKFSGSRTSAKRKEKIEDKCADAPTQDKERIHAKYSTLHSSPFKF
ncbi:MAG: hypothetical protein LBG78_07160 [Azoarcus sp.]|nr:hypothetical protein [Azoarcus sp.]